MQEKQDEGSILAQTQDDEDFLPDEDISARQLAANRANAQKSTGPKTPEGKARVSQNAVTHGFYSKNPVAPGEDPEEYAAFRTGRFDQLRPRGADQWYHARQVVAEEWRLMRLNRVEAEVYAELGENITALINALCKLSLHQMRLERSRDKNLKALLALQAGGSPTGGADQSPHRAAVGAAMGAPAMGTSAASGGKVKGRGHTRVDAVTEQLRQQTLASRAGSR